ncbi:cytoskeleton-associated protein 2 [Callorhinchus milii]|nr:cytoskeleton-associated protein 2 [Callorhinchus milii]
MVSEGKTPQAAWRKPSGVAQRNKPVQKKPATQSTSDSKVALSKSGEGEPSRVQIGSEGSGEASEPSLLLTDGQNEVPPDQSSQNEAENFQSITVEQNKALAAERGSKPKPAPASRPLPGSFRGRIVQSKVQSFRATSHQSEKRDRVDMTSNPDLTELKNEARGRLLKPRLKKATGIENVQPNRRTASATTTPNKPRILATATETKAPRNQRPLLTNTTVKTKPAVQLFTGNVKRPPPASKHSTAQRGSALSRSPSKGSPAKPARKAVGAHKPMKCKESAEEKRAWLPLWREQKESKKPTVPLQNSNPPEDSVKPFWTTILEEENQNKFGNQINNYLSNCLKQINEGCSENEATLTLNSFVENLPMAKKFARYWICLAKLEQRKGSIHDIIGIYEEAIKSGAQPAEELRNTLADILGNISSLQKNLGTEKPKGEVAQETTEPETESTTHAANSTEVQAPPADDPESLPAEEGENLAVEAYVLEEDTVDPPTGEQKPPVEEEEEEEDQGADPTADEVKQLIKQETEPGSDEGNRCLEEEANTAVNPFAKADGEEKVCKAETKEYDEDDEIEEIEDVSMLKTLERQISNEVENRGSAIKFNIKNTPILQNVKNMLQLENSNSGIKDLKFLTPVRRSHRIEKVAFQFPIMLQDHDPCVSSLEDLLEMGESTAYVVRANSALPHCSYPPTE